MIGSQLFSPLLTSITNTTRRAIFPRRWLSIPTIAFAYLMLIVLGMLLLYLPFTHQNGVRVTLLDSLFTATSAITLTGLVVRGIADSWNIIGQIILLILMQVGGLGYMTVATVLALRLGLRMGLRERLQLPEAQGLFRGRDVWRVASYALLATLIIEGIGALMLVWLLRQSGTASWGDSFFGGIFYAVSAFCNVGFDLQPGVYGFTASTLASNTWVLSVLGTLALLGGLGISVLAEVMLIRRLRRLSLHAKLVLLMTVILFIFGLLAFILFEAHNPATLASMESSVHRLVTAGFTSITTRSAGFSPVEISQLLPPTLLILGLLMLIGGAPGSMAGGVKLTTVAVIFLAILTLLRKRQDIEVFHRRISGEMVRLALSLLTIYLLTVLLAVIGLCIVEITLQGLLPTSETMNLYGQLVFEAMSAFGNVGLSSGITPGLHPISKVILILAMLIGRLGPLAFVFIFAQPKRPQLRHMPTESVMAG